MKILVIGGMHGNEPLGPAIVNLFKQQPIKNISAVLANKPALRNNCRFIEQDLNRCFPGSSGATAYEPRRAAQLLKLSTQYDLVIDFHNTHCPDNDCGFAGTTARPEVFEACRWLGLRRVIMVDYDCLNKYAPNCLSVEISLSSARFNPSEWYECLTRLSRLKVLSDKRPLERYQFVYRLTLEDKARYRLDSKKLKAFKAIDTSLATKLGVNSPAFPIFIADAYTPYNYGGLLNRLD